MGIEKEKLIEKLREKLNISFEEAKEALESCQWNILDAVVRLEQEGKISDANGECFYTNKNSESYYSSNALIDLSKEEVSHKFHKKENEFKLFEWICEVIDTCNSVLVKVSRRNEKIFEIPVTVLIVLTVFLVGSVIPIMIIALIFDVEFSVSSKKIDVTKVDETLKDLSSFVKGVKEKIKKEL